MKQNIGALIEPIQAQLARTSFLDFCRHMDPLFQTPPHIERIGGLLERVEDGRLRRLIVNLPPGHGKSKLLQMFSAWYLGKNPKRRIITTANAASLVERNSRDTRTLFEDARFPFAAKLSQESSAVSLWSLEPGRGGMYAIGVEGKVTGFRADLIVCDDIEHDASSESERAGVWRWFTEVLMPRLEPGGAIVMIGTRWHESDVFGRVLESPSADDWKVLSAPAIANDEDDPFGRKVGEPLWPQRWPLAELEGKKIEIGSRGFEAQYQGNPVPASGTLFKAEWLSRRYTVIKHLTTKVIAVDAAWKLGPQNDYSCILVAGTDGVDFYIVDVEKGRWEYPQLRQRVLDAYRRYHPDKVLVEDAAAGTGIIQELRSSTQLPIIGVVAKGSKESRAASVSPLLESGKVLLPDRAAWLEDFIAELLRFPAGKHDDQVDALVLALTQLRGASNAVPFAMTGRQPSATHDFFGTGGQDFFDDLFGGGGPGGGGFFDP